MRAIAVVGFIGLAGGAVLAGQLRAAALWGVARMPAAVPAPAPGAPDGGVAGICQSSVGPDVIVGEVGQFGGICKFGTIDGVSAYSMGTHACNIGDAVVQWQGGTSEHPVIAQNYYRLKGGRFEQLGLSWLKHGFASATDSLCCTCQNPGDDQIMGIGCSDPYGACQNGDQEGFPGCGGTCQGSGPRYEVNPTTGVYPYPYSTIGQSGNAIYKRPQIHVTDLDPAQNPGALYFGEAHYVTADDATAANHHNNASYKRITVGNFTNGSWGLSFTGDITPMLPAIYAWQDNDPQVVINVIEDDGGAPDAHDGRFRLGYRVTDNGNGTWHYEYAIYNMNSHRAARSFTVPVGANAVISNAGFHDVDYHSGDGEGGITFDGTDWSFAVGGGQASWSSETFAQNPNANALRWGTLYNFRFDANQPPVDVSATIGLFRPGSPTDLTVNTLGPAAGSPCPWDCADGNGTVDVIDFLALLSEWGQAGSPCDLGLGVPGVGIEEFLDLLSNWGDCP
jgi:hypothetical protein